MLTNTGTLFYKAPEMLLSANYSESVDVWSIGVITYQLVSGQLPFYADQLKDVTDQICQCQYSFTARDTMPCVSLQDFMKDSPCEDTPSQVDGKGRIDGSINALAQEKEQNVWDEVSITVKDFIRRILKLDNRLTIAECLLHKWFINSPQCINKARSCVQTMGVIPREDLGNEGEALDFSSSKIIQWLSSPTGASPLDRNKLLMQLQPLQDIPGSKSNIYIDEGSPEYRERYKVLAQLIQIQEKCTDHHLKMSSCDDSPRSSERDAE